MQSTSAEKNFGSETYGGSKKSGNLTPIGTVESQTARVPSDTFLWAALGSIGLSLTFQMLGKKEEANFVGQWAPTFLCLGIYNKFVKLAGGEERRPGEREKYSPELPSPL
jgi:hypothetical protein